MNAPLPGVAIDTRPLDQLRATAKTAPDKALAAAARFMTRPTTSTSTATTARMTNNVISGRCMPNSASSE